MALVGNNPQPKRKKKGNGEELVSNKQVYSWNNNFNGLRDNRRGSWQGAMMANFKRGSGDLMGVAGGLNDNAAIPAPVESFYPNNFGLYNMSGNVSEWVEDVYRPQTYEVSDDFNSFRGNRFQKLKIKDPTATDPIDKYATDSLTGKVLYEDESDSALSKRRNYQKSYAINFLDGDSLSQTNYGYGKTTLVSDSSRVIKGGSWNDRPYWLSPGTRRYLEENQGSSTVGFRCAMNSVGAGNTQIKGTKQGNYFPAKKQRR